MLACHSDMTQSEQRERTALRQCADLHPRGGHVAMSHKSFPCGQRFGDRHSGRGQARRTAQLCAPCTLNISCFGHKKTPCALRAWAWGGRGRRFKSGHSDQYVKTAFRYCGEPLFSCQNILIQKSSDGKSELLVLYYIFASFANSAFSAG